MEDGSSTIYIAGVARADGGRYTLTLENKVDKATGWCHVTVLGMFPCRQSLAKKSKAFLISRLG